MGNYKEILKNINMIAKEYLEEDNLLVPVAFIIKNKRILIHVIFSDIDDYTKNIGYISVGEMAKRFAADAVILMNDAATRKYKCSKDSEYAIKNKDTEMPLSYPESMRRDAMLFSVIDFKKMDISEIYVQQYEKIRGKYKYSELQDISSKIVKNEENYQEIILKGYNLKNSQKTFLQFLQEEKTEDDIDE